VAQLHELAGSCGVYCSSTQDQTGGWFCCGLMVCLGSIVAGLVPHLLLECDDRVKGIHSVGVDVDVDECAAGGVARDWRRAVGARAPEHAVA
jgi:hypothetical protein